MNDVKITWSYGKENFSPCEFIRKEVFMKEQGFKNEFDEQDETCYHLVLTVDGKPAGTARLFSEEDGIFHAGRICILKEFRNLHLGALIVSSFSKKAKELGGKEILISAQLDKEGFYKKQGFTSYGEVYNDEHCPHINMKKEI